MKIHNDFTLYFRVVPSGKKVVYYYAYDSDGKRIYGKSTGETTKTAARRKCNQLLKDGLLVPNKSYMPTFAEYAVGWWDWELCKYLKKQRKVNELTKNYADKAKQIMERELLPYFGNMPMDKITVEVIEDFRDSLTEKGYKNTTNNSYYSVLKTMLIEAEERGVILKNPTAKLRKLKKNCKPMQIITREEYKKLFLGDWAKVWENDRIAYTFNLLASVTGMRASEVLGLKGCFVYDEHIYLCMQHDQYGYRKTKTKDQCNLPVPAFVMKALKELKKVNGDGFIFSENGGAKPVTRAVIYYRFEKAWNNIGITTEEMRERKIHLHAWRHFLNTQLLKSGLSIPQTQAITRHKSERMTENYLHFDSSDYAKAKAVQEDLLNPNTDKPEEKPKTATAEGKAERRSNVRKFPVRKTA